jgi:hypothetical protein
MRQVKLPADPRLAWASVLLPISLFATVWAWGALGWQARGMLLAAYGVAVALVLLLPALRTRARLKAGVSAQGTVVGAEKRISSTGIGTWAPTFVPNHPLPPEGAVHHAGRPHGGVHLGIGLPRQRA